MRPPIPASTSSTSLSGAAFSNGAHLRTKNQLCQKEVLAENRKGTSYSEGDNKYHYNELVAPVSPVSPALPEFAGRVKNAGSRDGRTDCDVGYNHGTYSTGPKPSGSETKCMKINKNELSDLKNGRRHSDSLTARSKANVDSYQIVNTCSDSDSDIVGTESGRRNKNCENNYLANGGKSVSQTFYESEISPLLERDAKSSISLVKNNSASLIFTKKEFIPVVHRNKSVSKSGLTTDTVQEQRRSLQLNSGLNFSNYSNNNQNNNNNNSNSALQERRKHAKSWYASIYSTLDEVAELDLKVSPCLFYSHVRRGLSIEMANGIGHSLTLFI